MLENWNYYGFGGGEEEAKIEVSTILSITKLKSWEVVLFLLSLILFAVIASFQP